MLSGEWPAFPLRLWGMCRLPSTGFIAEPKDAVTRRCRHCGWLNIFDRADTPHMQATNWREIQLKQG